MDTSESTSVAGSRRSRSRRKSPPRKANDLTSCLGYAVKAPKAVSDRTSSYSFASRTGSRYGQSIFRGEKELALFLAICKKRKEAENTMYRRIWNCIVEDKLRVYQEKRGTRKGDIQELEKGRVKIQKRKKTMAYKRRKLLKNSRKIFTLLAKSLGETALHFKKLYNASDGERQIQMSLAENGITLTEEQYENKHQTLSIAIQALQEQRALIGSQVDHFKMRLKTAFSKLISDSQKQMEASGRGGPSPARPRRRISKALPHGSPQTSRNKTLFKYSTEGSAASSPRSFQRLTMLNQKSFLGKGHQDGLQYLRASALDSQEKALREFRRYLERTQEGDPDKRIQMQVQQLNHFFRSPFRHDQTFALEYVVQLTGAFRLENREEDTSKAATVYESLFYDQIYGVILDPGQEIIHVEKAYKIVCNLMQFKKQRDRLTQGDYLKRIFDRAYLPLRNQGEKTAKETSVGGETSQGEKVDGEPHGGDKSSQLEDQKRTQDAKADHPDNLTDSPNPASVSESSQGSPIWEAAADPSPGYRVQKPTATPLWGLKLEDAQGEKARTKNQNRVLLYLSQLAYHITFYVQSMKDEVIRINLLPWLIQMVQPDLPSEIRQNSMLAVSMLSQSAEMFDEFLKHGAIDLALSVCKSAEKDYEMKQAASMTLVNFALNQPDIKILLDKGIMDLFENFREKESKPQWGTPTGARGDSFLRRHDHIIKTNISWLFFALCRNKIQSKVMLERGITRDMFLVACNSQYNKIRHLVIAGFTLLGRDDLNAFSMAPCKAGDETTQEKIKSEAIYRFQKNIEFETLASPEFVSFNASTGRETNIDILLKFSASSDQNYQISALRSLRDYMILFIKTLDFRHIEQICRAFIVGSISENEQIQTISINAISFLVTHRVVYQHCEAEQQRDNRKRSAKTAAGSKVSSRSVHDRALLTQQLAKEIEEIKEQDKASHILDAMMYCSSSGCNSIRSIAFSAMNSLSNFSSQYQSVMAQVQRDVKTTGSESYFEFVEQRLFHEKQNFLRDLKVEHIETIYSGVFSLTQLAFSAEQDDIDKAMDAFQLHLVVVKADVDSRRRETSKCEYGPKSPAEVNSAHAPPERQGESTNDKENLRHGDAAQKNRNEQFFVSVFKTLMRVNEIETIYKLLEVIKFYSDNFVKEDKEGGNTCWKQIINPDTILWLLELIKTNIENKHLSCLCSLTLLGIVEKHELEIEYQQQAIIKLFNQILLRMELFQKNDGDDGQSPDDSNSGDESLEEDSYGGMLDESVSKTASALFQSQRRWVDNEDEVEPRVPLSLDSAPESASSGKSAESKGHLTTVKQSSWSQSVPDTFIKNSIKSKSRQQSASRSKKSSGYSPLSQGTTSQIKPGVKMLSNSSKMVAAPGMKLLNLAAGPPRRGSALSDLQTIYQEENEDTTPNVEHPHLPAGPKKPDLNGQVGGGMGEDSDDEEEESHFEFPVGGARKKLEKKRASKKCIYRLTRMSSLFFKRKDLLVTKDAGSGKLLQKQLQRSRLTYQSRNFASSSDQLGSPKAFISVPSKTQGRDITFKQFRENSEKDLLHSSSGSQPAAEMERLLKKTNDSQQELSKIDSQPSAKSLSVSLSIQSSPSAEQIKAKKVQLRSVLPGASSCHSVSDEEEASSSDEEEEIKDTRLAFDYIRQMKRQLQKPESDSNSSGSLTESNTYEINQTQERMLRDSFIKTFMLIFTNEENHYLLLNNDLIEITLNCLEHGQDIKIEAQLKSARLASQLLKFPRIQTRFFRNNQGSAIKGMYSIMIKICSKEGDFAQAEKAPGELQSLKEAIIRNNGHNHLDQEQDKRLYQLEKLEKNIETLQSLILALSFVSDVLRRQVYFDLSQCIHSALIQLLQCPSIVKRFVHVDYLRILQVLRDTQIGSDKNCEDFTRSPCYHMILVIIDKGVATLPSQSELDQEGRDKEDDAKDTGQKVRFQAETQVPILGLNQLVDSIQQSQQEGITTQGDNLSADGWNIEPVSLTLEEQLINSMCLSILENIFMRKETVAKLMGKEESRNQIMTTTRKTLHLTQAWSYDQLGMQLDQVKQMSAIVTHDLSLRESCVSVQDLGKPSLQEKRSNDSRKGLMRIESEQPSPLSSSTSTQSLGSIPSNSLSSIAPSNSNNEASPAPNFQLLFTKLPSRAKQKLRAQQLEEEQKTKMAINKQREIDMTRAFQSQCSMIKSRISAYSLISRMCQNTSQDELQTVESQLLGDLQLITILVQDFEKISEILTLPIYKIEQEDPLRAEIEHLCEQMVEQHEELLDNILNCMKSLQNSHMFIKKITSPWVYFKNLNARPTSFGFPASDDNQVNTPLDQILIIMRKLVKTSHPKILPLCHTLAVLVFETLRYTELNSDSYRLNHLAKQLSLLFKLTSSCASDEHALQRVILNLFYSVLSTVSRVAEDKGEVSRLGEIMVDQQNMAELQNNLESQDQRVLLSTLKVLGLLLENQEEVSAKNMKLMVIQEETPFGFSDQFASQVQNSRNQFLSQKAKTSLQQQSIQGKIVSLSQSDRPILKDNQIQAALAVCLEKIGHTQPGVPANLESAMKDVKKFQKYMIQLALEKKYEIAQEIDSNDSGSLKGEDAFDLEDFELNSNISDDAPADQRSTMRAQVQNSFRCAVFSQLEEDVEAPQPDNAVLQSVIQCLANFTKELSANQKVKILKASIEYGLIQLCRNLLNTLIKWEDNDDKESKGGELTGTGEGDEDKESECDKIDLLKYKTGTIELFRNVSLILVNLSKICSFSQDQETAAYSLKFMEFLMIRTDYLAILKEFLSRVIEFEVQVNLIQCVGNILLLGGPTCDRKLEIQGFLVQNGYFQLLIDNLEDPPNSWQTVQGYCSDYISRLQVNDMHVIKYHQKLQRKKEKQLAKALLQLPSGGGHQTRNINIVTNDDTGESSMTEGSVFGKARSFNFALAEPKN